MIFQLKEGRMHLNWANVTLSVLLLVRVWYAVVSNGRPVYEMSAKKGVWWVATIVFLLWAGGFWR